MTKLVANPVVPVKSIPIEVAIRTSVTGYLTLSLRLGKSQMILTYSECTIYRLWGTHVGMTQILV